MRRESMPVSAVRPTTLEIAGPDESAGDGGGLAAGDAGDDEVEGIADARHGGNGAVDFDGGDEIGFEDFIGVDFFGASDVGAGAGLDEFFAEEGANAGGHVAGAGAGKLGDDGVAFDVEWRGIGEDGVFADGVGEGGVEP